MTTPCEDYVVVISQPHSTSCRRVRDALEARNNDTEKTGTRSQFQNPFRADELRMEDEVLGKYEAC